MCARDATHDGRGGERAFAAFAVFADFVDEADADLLRALKWAMSCSERLRRGSQVSRDGGYPAQRTRYRPLW